MNVDSWGLTRVLLHPGHRGLVFSRSEIVITSSNGFPHFSQWNSYLGIGCLLLRPSSSLRRPWRSTRWLPRPAWLAPSQRRPLTVGEAPEMRPASPRMIPHAGPGRERRRA